MKARNLKKSILAAGLTIWASTADLSQVESHIKPQYANVFVTVWQLADDHSDFLEKLRAPIPRIFTDSWLSTSYFQDVADGKLHTKTLEKDTIKIDITSGKIVQLTVHVWEEGELIFKNILLRSSTLRTIFYGKNSQPYLLDVSFSFSDHPIGIIRPGIMRSDPSK